MSYILPLNTLVSERTKSTGFALMYGRSFNGFEDFSYVKGRVADVTSMVEERLAFWKKFQEVVAPAVADRTSRYRDKIKEKMDSSHKVTGPLAVGTKVMALDHTRSSKWDPKYEGPYTVAICHKGDSYTLKGPDGQMLPRRRKLDTLKVIPSLVSPTGGEEGTQNDSNDHYEVERILDHEMMPDGSQHRFYVKWKGWPDSDNSWVKHSDFDDLAIIKKYWKQREEKEKKIQKELVKNNKIAPVKMAERKQRKANKS